MALGRRPAACHCGDHRAGQTPLVLQDVDLSPEPRAALCADVCKLIERVRSKCLGALRGAYRSSGPALES